MSTGQSFADAYLSEMRNLVRWRVTNNVRLYGCPRCGGREYCRSNKGHKRSHHRVMAKLVRDLAIEPVTPPSWERRPN